MIKLKKINSEEKLKFFIKEDLEKKKNINILEFGVHSGISTKLFLNIVKKNGGKLISVDTANYSKSFKSKQWKFINTRDDNYSLISTKIPKKLDLIYLDTQHNANHIKKIFYQYINQLKIGGIFLIDDIFWLPYIRKGYRDNFHIEINNRESFEAVMEIYNSNQNNFDLLLTPKHTGMAKFIKLNEQKINCCKKILNRQITLKNFLRKLRNSFN